jgi:predicted ester cyclase
MKYFIFWLLCFSLFATEENLQVKRIEKVFNDLNVKNMHILDEFYSKDVVFEDPIGKHKGLESVKKYYVNMYKNVEDINFEFKRSVSEGNSHVVTWVMKLKSKKLKKGETLTLHGNSFIEFGQDNLVSYHRDYFDMSQFIYENLPGIGWVFKKFRESFSQ